MDCLLAASDGWQSLAQYCWMGLIFGMVYALIALGYTMVYGIVELINFAHGDLFMLGTFFALTLLSVIGISAAGEVDPWLAVGGVLLCLVLTPVFCAGLNWGIDRAVYRRLRNAPKLAPLVSAIGVSFILQNVGLFWNGAVYEDNKPVAAASPRAFPALIPNDSPFDGGGLRLPLVDIVLRVTYRDLMVVGLTIPVMIALTYLVRVTTLGKSMRAVAQNPVAARFMGIDVDRVIRATFLIGGALAGVAAVVYGLYFNTTSYQAGFQNGLYAFTAAVVGGIGNIPGAVLGGLMIGLTRSLGSAYVGEQWTSALVFAILIIVLVFRPTGILGSRLKEKV